MNEDIIINVAKRTAVEILTQLKDTPYLVIPFALAGVFFSTLTSIAIVITLMIAMVAYFEYKDLLKEIEEDVKNATYEAEQARTETTVTPAEPAQQAEAEPTVVVAETEKK